MAAEAVSSPKIAEIVGVNRNQVDLWKHRYRDEGLAGLGDRDRPGRPPTYGPEDRLMLVKTITTRPVEDGQLSPKRRKARMSMPEVARILKRSLRHRDLRIAGMADLQTDEDQTLAGAVMDDLP